MRILFSPPNLLTCARILLTPWIVLALIHGDCRKALWLSCVAGVTDGADGFLARRFGWASRIGAYLDPIADKFLLTSLYVCFGISHLIPWWLVWLVVGRDVLILVLAGLGLLLTSRREFPPTLWGKVSTVAQIAAAVIFLCVCAFPFSLAEDLRSAAQVAVTAATAWSGVHYTWRALIWMRE
ncbi:MAG TPA: CDP-alcohol phosphatidyltransferase family protein [Burkholderiales bacterium]|nr:CDP-alcohol phosphatidyltransferase family protein [Burkholderiales bacterium]